MLQIATNNNVIINHSPTQYYIVQEQDRTRCYSRAGDVTLPKQRYSLNNDNDKQHVECFLTNLRQ